MNSEIFIIGVYATAILKTYEKPLVLDQHALTEIVFVIHMCGKGTAAAILKAGQQLLHTTDIEYRSLIRKAMPGNR